MYVVSVTPLTKNTSLGALSYYSSVAYEIGTLLEIPVRNKQITGIVTNTESVGAAKTALRAATFTLRKLSPQKDRPTLPHNFLETARQLTDTVPAPIGTILYQLLPPEVRNGQKMYPFTSEHTNHEDSTPSLLTGHTADRHRNYRSLIREAFAHRGSTMLVVPTAAAVETAQRALSSGVEKRIVTFASTQTKKQRDQAYETFSDFQTAKLIICTPQYAFLDRHDITHIIVDEAGSPHYKMRTRPYLDFRHTIQVYARISGRAVLFGDTLPRTDEEAMRREETFNTAEEHPLRLDFTNRFTIARHPETRQTKEYALCTELLRDTITKTLDARGQIVLFSARRGLAPLVLCYDCGYIFRCPDSGAPYSLFEETTSGGETKRFFYSSLTGRKVPAADTCPECESWRLYEQGIGVQQVLNYIKKEFPHIDPILFDHTTATTHQKAKALAKQFYDKKGALMVATNMVLPYLHKPVSTTAVISYEALRAVPTWRAEEQTLATLLAIRERSSNECVIQTRSEPDKLLRYAKRALIDEFYTEEITMRQILSYPPFTQFILLTWTGDKNTVQSVERLVKKTLAGTDIQCYSPQVHADTYRRHGLIKIPYGDWPQSELMDTLRSLPPHIRIEVDPDRII